MYRFQSIILVTVLFALLSSCANQIAPEGGPKDETPPTLVSSTPKQGEVNFDGQEIQLTFDEYVNTNQPKQEIIITPTILQEYDIKVRKKVVTLTFEEPLDDSTTYTINFREAIQDITEKNTPTDLKLAFSTGSFLDSMSVEGTVLNLLTQKPLANITVGIYKVSDTLDIIEHKPTYFTKTSDDGKYKIENVKAGEYEILAFNDANKNLTLQTSSEAYGFLTNSITLDTALSQIDFVANILDLDTIQITRSRQIATTYHVKYNKYVNQYNVVSFDSSDYIYSNFIDNSHETIQLYNTFDIQDSIPIFITVSDSLNTQQTDTLFLQFKENKRKPAEFQSSLNLKKIATNVKQLSASLTFTKPVQQYNFDSTYIYIDSTHIYYLDTTKYTWNYSLDKLNVIYTLPDSIFDQTETEPQNNTTAQPDQVVTASDNEEANETEEPSTQSSDSTKTDTREEQSPHLYFGKSSFISTELDSSQSLKQPLVFIKPESLGIIEFNVETEEACYFIQVLNDKYEVVRELYNPTNTILENLEPNQYKIRVIIDSNCNQRWDFGNLLNNTPPERVIIHKLPDDIEDIILRANWVNPIGIIKF